MKFQCSKSLFHAIHLGWALALIGCTVGPDFRRPPAPAANGYQMSPLPLGTTRQEEIAKGELQRLTKTKVLSAQWWTLFHSQPLNALVERALKSNPNVTAAQAALRSAWEIVYAQQGLYFPSVSGQVDPSRQKIAGSLASPAASASYMYSLTTTQVNVSFVPDVFGGNRRQVESLEAQAEMQRFQLEATYLTLTSSLVNAAIQEANLSAQIAATQDILDSETNVLDSFRRQYSLGQLAEADVAGQEAALAQIEATVPPLQKQQSQQRDLLIALAGELPDQDTLPHFELSDFNLPEELPVSLPSDLVEQRQDIRVAEAELHTASAQIGVAMANRLPNISINASFGNASDRFGKLFSTSNTFWNVAANLTQPIFDGGTLLHRERAAKATYDQVAAQYRSTVITAVQNVADTLHAIQSDADALKAARHAERTAARSLEITRRRLELGDVNFVTVLVTEQSYQQARIGLAVAQANRLQDSVALFQALGGGWWNRTEVSNSQHRDRN